MRHIFKKIFVGPIDWFVYTVLNEKQRRAITGLFSEDVKDKLKQLTSGGKYRAQRHQLQQIKRHLYNFGFMSKGLEDLKKFYDATEDEHVKRLIAWELAQWHANDYSKEQANKALTYLKIAKQGEKENDQLRRIAIIEAEMYDLLEEQETGKEIIEEALKRETHPDLYFARANLEGTLEGRLHYFNRVMDLFDLAPITFKDGGTSYDDIQTTPIDRKITDGPKVSVILPAYNAEVGIQTAIESILSQTWRNLELLIVDDCSPDGTLDVIKQYAEQDERIKVFQTPENSGPYVARNIALKEATGEFVTVNDADDWSHAEKIERQVKHLVENPNIIANTSGHARLTEELKAYRRGTPGKYIFPNMSSLMFRREPVIENLGFWDSVRFAADGEFKRRLLRAFGKDSIVDLETGPLSLPRQSVTSLTASSAFGYNGFFMGARKEYVEAFSAYHELADSLYYPYPQQKRLFPVPEPMWPQREDKRSGRREFDVVLVADFRKDDSFVYDELMRQCELDKRVALVQLNHYDLQEEGPIQDNIRQLIDGQLVQMTVYGEQLDSETLLLLHPNALLYKQAYIPNVKTEDIRVLINEDTILTNMKVAEHIKAYFGKESVWYPMNQSIQDKLNDQQLDHLHIANQVWENV